MIGAKELYDKTVEQCNAYLATKWIGIGKKQIPEDEVKNLKREEEAIIMVIRWMMDILADAENGAE